MVGVEQIKSVAQRLTGLRRPSADQLARLLRRAKPAAYRFRDDGFIPNNPRWPLVIYRGAISLPRSLDPAAVWEALFQSNDWSGTWRGEIYDYLHYHSRTHEVLGVARGRASVRLGGSKGRTLELKAGDAVILPAGTGHQSLSASKTFLAVGAYPPSGIYDECGPSVEEHARAVKAVRKVARPRSDPVFGSKGPLIELWQATRSRT
jgi:uncharacterized protein YjlB